MLPLVMFTDHNIIPKPETPNTKEVQDREFHERRQRSHLLQRAMLTVPVIWEVLRCLSSHVFPCRMFGISSTGKRDSTSGRVRCILKLAAGRNKWPRLRNAVSFRNFRRLKVCLEKRVPQAEVRA